MTTTSTTTPIKRPAPPPVVTPKASVKEVTRPAPPKATKPVKQPVTKPITQPVTKPVTQGVTKPEEKVTHEKKQQQYPYKSSYSTASAAYSECRIPVVSYCVMWPCRSV